MPGERTLTVDCRAGLCNRLMVLFSGMALAEATGRDFCMLWKRTASCGATFEELFRNSWNVVEAESCQEPPKSWIDARNSFLIHNRSLSL